MQLINVEMIQVCVVIDENPWEKKRGNTFFLEVSIETISIIKRVKLLSLTQTLY